MPGEDPPLSALLSQALVAFVIEFDNEFEHRMPHRTTNHGTQGGGHSPWLVSMAMWMHCLRHVPDDGITAGELVRRARLSAASTELIVRRMSSWWGYLTVRRPADAGSGARRADWVILPTAAGRKARDVWEPLASVVEDRWRDRHGSDAIDHLVDALGPVVRAEPGLPDFVPVGQQSGHIRDGLSRRPDLVIHSADDLSLAALLSRALVSFALAFESDSLLPLQFEANVLRVVAAATDSVAARDLPALTGIARMGTDNVFNALARQDYLSVSTGGPRGRTSLIRLTGRGRSASRDYEPRAANTERGWESRFGIDPVRALRSALSPLVGDGSSRGSPLFEGLQPYPDGWRSQVREREVLPHFPMVSLRGGFPDGS